jgi:hypothetical protein
MMQRISRRVGLAAVVAVAHAPLAAVGGLWCLRREGTRRCRLTGLFCVIERVLTSRRRRPDGVPEQRSGGVWLLLGKRIIDSCGPSAGLL